MPRTAEIIAVGSELLTGGVTNTNARLLSELLTASGVDVLYHTAVGDDEGRLEAAVTAAKRRAALLVFTGGLGPTYDDMTKTAVCAALDTPLVFHPEVADEIRRYFDTVFHREMPACNLQQAYLPEGCTVFHNPVGTAPGCAFETGGVHVLMLPGPPRECMTMFRLSAMPYLQKLSGDEIISHNLHIFGMGESEVDTRLRDLENGENPTLSPYCALGEVQLRATASADTAEKALALLTPLLAEVKARLGNVVYAIEETDGGSLAKTAIETLRAQGMTCATCESLTGGKVVAALVDIPGASAVVRAGLVTYQTDTKTILADVPAEVIKRFGVVSVETACAMAEGTRKRLGVDIAVSTTGVAGPDGGTEDCPVGTVCVGVSTAGGTSAVRLALSGNRDRIRTLAMKHALHMLIEKAR